MEIQKGAVLLALVLAPLALPRASAAPGEELDLKALFREGIPKSPFIAPVYAYANAMLDHGRDAAGPLPSGLFLSALDRKTLSPLKELPPPPAGVQAERRPGPRGQPLTGANLQMDENLIRLLFFLRELSGEEKYSRAAEEALRWFLQNAQAPTGLLPWGAYLSWDAAADSRASGRAEPTHELSRPWLLWERCFALAPEASRRFALALWTAHAADRERGVLDPSVDLERPAPRAGAESPRHAGFSVRTWAEAHAHSGEPVFLEAIGAVLRRHEGAPERDPAGAPPGAGASPAGRLSLAIDCHGAARKVPEPLRTRLALLAAREDAAFCGLSHPLAERKGFLSGPQAGPADPACTSLWDVGGGEETTAKVALMCVARYENGGDRRHRDLMVAAAGAYLDSLPGASCDAWPMTFGHAISLELAAFRATTKEKYFRAAYRLGEVALERFFGGAPLPRASLKSEHYENTTGADTLALALAELHLTTLHITAVRAPANTADR